MEAQPCRTDGSISPRLFTYLRKYYELKSVQKPKMVAIGAVMHKVCNVVFAVLRDKKAFELRSPEEHCKQYQRAALAAA